MRELAKKAGIFSHEASSVFLRLESGGFVSFNSSCHCHDLFTDPVTHTVCRSAVQLKICLNQPLDKTGLGGMLYAKMLYFGPELSLVTLANREVA